MQRPDDDLFKDSTMTFGEHLDELRVALFKAVLVISVGVIAAFFVARWVVIKIKDPLQQALQNYYSQQAIHDFQQRVQKRKDAGEKVPPEWEDPKFIDEMVNRKRMVFEEVYVDPKQFLATSLPSDTQKLQELPSPGLNATQVPDKTSLKRILLWHTIEDDSRAKVITLGAEEAFFIYMKAAIVTGIVLASPPALYFLWSFVAAGLYPHEKKYVYIFLPFSLCLFLAGVSLTYFLVFPKVLEFFFSFNEWLGMDAYPRISEWVGFVLLLPLSFGVCFQLPLVMLFLQRIGIFSTQNYWDKWRVAVLIMAFLAMVITPTADPYTMLMLLVPLTLLYFGGILLCQWMPGSRNPYKSQR